MPGLTTELTGVPSAFMTSIQVLPSRDTWMVSRTEGLQPEGITISTGALPFGMLIPLEKIWLLGMVMEYVVGPLALGSTLVVISVSFPQNNGTGIWSPASRTRSYDCT